MSMNKSSNLKSVTTWCSDKLHSILGYSDTALASYLASIAMNSKSYHGILSKLKEGDVTPIIHNNDNHDKNNAKKSRSSHRPSTSKIKLKF